MTSAQVVFAIVRLPFLTNIQKIHAENVEDEGNIKSDSKKSPFSRINLSERQKPDFIFQFIKYFIGYLFKILHFRAK